MNEENAPNVNVVVTQQPGFKRVLKIVLILFFFIVLAIGLILYFSKKKTAQNANNQPENNSVAVSAGAGPGGSGGSATVSAQTPVNAEASSALEAKIVDISVDTVSFETINQELIILPASKITNGSYMVLNTPVKLILTKSSKDGTIIKAEVTKLNPR